MLIWNNDKKWISAFGRFKSIWPPFNVSGRVIYDANLRRFLFTGCLDAPSLGYGWRRSGAIIFGLNGTERGLPSFWSAFVSVEHQPGSLQMLPVHLDNAIDCHRFQLRDSKTITYGNLRVVIIRWVMSVNRLNGLSEVQTLNLLGCRRRLSIRESRNGVDVQRAGNAAFLLGGHGSPHIAPLTW